MHILLFFIKHSESGELLKAHWTSNFVVQFPNKKPAASGHKFSIQNQVAGIVSVSCIFNFY